LLAVLHAICCWYGEILWRGALELCFSSSQIKKLQNGFYVMKLTEKETGKNMKEYF
jgi:hypothetical protein